MYDQLLALTPSPVAALQRAIAVAEVDGPDAALTLVDALGLDLDRYHSFHSIRADLLRRPGRNPEAALTNETAIDRTDNATERDFLQRSRHTLSRAR